MAISSVKEDSERRTITFLSSDTKPTSGYEEGQEGRETDTGNYFEFFGGVWYPVGTAGVRNSNISNSASLIWPNTQRTDSSVTGAAAGTIYAPTDISMYNMHLLIVSGLTATSVDVFGTVDGITANRGALDVYNFATQAYQANIIANGIYAIGDKAGISGLKTIELDQVGAGAVTVRYSHSVN